MAWILQQKNTQIKKIRTDNGGEYIGKEFRDICAKSGIIHETTPPYTPFKKIGRLQGSHIPHSKVLETIY